ncbi:hypothetical protein I4U23_011872 [Adineta vaga]|nr:hypothetical protein I4U23_011872 [Adineta vaga]
MSFDRKDAADQIHDREVCSSLSQIGEHLTRIQSRLHVFPLCTTIDEQFRLIRFGLDQATKEQ